VDRDSPPPPQPIAQRPKYLEMLNFIEEENKKSEGKKGQKKLSLSQISNKMYDDLKGRLIQKHKVTFVEAEFVSEKFIGPGLDWSWLEYINLYANFFDGYFSEEDNDNEAAMYPFISWQILTLIKAYVEDRKLAKKIKLAPQKSVTLKKVTVDAQGKKMEENVISGKCDFALEYQDMVLVVQEVKKGEAKEALGQMFFAMEGFSDDKGRGTIGGIATNFTDVILMLDTPTHVFTDTMSCNVPRDAVFNRQMVLNPDDLIVENQPRPLVGSKSLAGKIFWMLDILGNSLSFTTTYQISHLSFFIVQLAAKYPKSPPPHDGSSLVKVRAVESTV